jgi:hypothetical protein
MHLPNAIQTEVMTMEMFLMALCLSMFGLAVSAIAFGAATRPEKSSSPSQPELRPAKPATAGRFFADSIPALPARPPAIPTEVLLAKIEHHVRLEQAAAQSFLESPSHAQLHTKTTSQLVN